MRIDEAGMFWVALPERREIKRAEAVPGRLLVGDDGQITLELQGYLPGGDDIFSRFGGVLTDSSRHIHLRDISRASINMNRQGYFETYRASTCLVGSYERISDFDMEFNDVEFDISSLSAWTRLQNIQFTRKDDNASAIYNKPSDLRYANEDSHSVFSIKFGLKAPWSGQSANINLKESAYINFSSKASMEIKEATKMCVVLRDFLTLLIGSDEPLGLPYFSCLSKPDEKAILYSWRDAQGRRPLNVFDCWTNLLMLQSDLGRLFFRWPEKRDAFGPGFYMLLGTKRLPSLSTEHEFNSYAMGLEAFSRTKGGLAPDPHDILMRECVLTSAHFKDVREWVENELRYSHEPSLFKRLQVLFKDLPFDIKKRCIKRFSRTFALTRNETAHYGGSRSRILPYDIFIQKLMTINNAVSVMYHALILLEIGVDADHIKKFVLDGGGHLHRVHLEYAGLLPPNLSNQNDRLNPQRNPAKRLVLTH